MCIGCHLERCQNCENTLHPGYILKGISDFLGSIPWRPENWFDTKSYHHTLYHIGLLIVDWRRHDTANKWCVVQIVMLFADNVLLIYLYQYAWLLFFLVRCSIQALQYFIVLNRSYITTVHMYKSHGIIKIWAQQEVKNNIVWQAFIKKNNTRVLTN